MTGIVKTGGHTKPTSRLDAALSSTALVLDPDWTPAEPLPAEYRDKIPDALAVAEQAIQPADSETFCMAMDTLVDWIETFGVIELPTDEARYERKIRQISASYHKTLGDLPGDLLLYAIEETTKRAKYRVLPMPGDVRAIVAGALEDRHHAVRRLTTAKRLGKFETGRRPSHLRVVRDPDEEQRVRDAVEQATRMLAEDRENLAWTHTDPREREPSPLSQQYREARHAVASAPRKLVPRPWAEGRASNGSDGE